MGQYTEGQRLQGSDGHVYVVRNGVPVLETPGMSSPKLPGELTGQTLQNTRTQQEIDAANATAAANTAKAKAEAQSAEIAAKTAQEAYDAAHPKGTGSTVFGPAYLQTLAPPDAELVKALAEGRLAFPGGFALKAPWWQQKLEQVAQYDPSFDATNYNNRAKARAALISGKLGASANSLNTAIGHVGHLSEQIGGTSSLGDFPFATDINSAINFYNRHAGQSGITNFQDTAQKLADELESVYRNGGGAEQGVVRQLRSLDPNASLDQKNGIIRNALELLASKQAANLYQYNIGSGGKPPVDLLDPPARKVLDQFPDIRDKYFAPQEQAISKDAAALITAHGGAIPPTPPSGGGGGGGTPPITNLYGPTPGTPGAPIYNPLAGESGNNSGPNVGLYDTGPGQKSLPIPPEMQAAHTQYLTQHWGKIDPNDYAAFREKLDRQYGFASRPDAYKAIVPDLNARAKSGGFPTGLGIPPVNVKANAQDRFNASVFNNPVGAAMLGFGSLGGGADELAALAQTPFSNRTFRENLDRANATRQAAAEAFPKATLAGNVLGTIGDAYALGGLAPGIAKLAISSPVVSGVGYGALSGALENNDNRVGGAAGGAVLGGAGGAAGKYLVAPVAKAVMDTRAGQAISNALRPGINRALGMFGNRSPQVAAISDAVNLQPWERALPGSDVLSGARTNLEDAANLGLPYSLADADPKLRLLAGSVARKSPNARQLAENTFDPRALGQADRAVNAIDTNLAPITDIGQRSADLLDAADQAAAPYYNLAFSRPGPVDPEIGAMLDTPAGRASLANARTIAANKRMDPNALGFDLNDQGDVVLRSVPSYKTLQLTKRGMDAHLNSFADQFGNVNLRGNPLAQSVMDLKTDFNNRLGVLNDNYAKGNDIWSGYAARRDALNLGNNVLPNNAVPQAQFERQLASLNGETLPEAQMGFATNMADTVNRARLSTNPYNSIYGSPLQQAKVGALFPEGAGNFDRIYNLENDMAKTRAETLGGSPTAARTAADAIFDSPGGMALDTALTLHTGGVSPRMGLRLGQKALDAYRLGLGQKRADALAPILFNTDPASMTDVLDQIALRKAQEAARAQAFGSRYGMFGALATPSLQGP